MIENTTPPMAESHAIFTHSGAAFPVCAGDHGSNGQPAAEFHPIANLFPMMSEAELDKLANDIICNGVQVPIVRHRDGRIIDGRNRWLACQRAGIECPSRTYSGDLSLVSFVVALNLNRRHLTTDQRAAIAVDLTNLGRGQKKADTSIDVSQPEAAKLLKVGVASVQRAATVKRADPGLHEKVKRGEVKAGQARAKVAANKPKTTLAKSDAEDRQKQADRTALINALEGFRQRQKLDWLVTIVRKHVPEVETATPEASTTPKPPTPPPPHAEGLVTELRSVCLNHLRCRADIGVDDVCAALRELCRQVELGGLTAMAVAA